MPVNGTQAEPHVSTTLRGVTLEQYAGITAALADEFPLAEVLANEQIRRNAWARIELAWKARLAEDGAEGALFAAFRAKRSEAEDWLTREVTPIDRDLGAWLTFLQAWSSHPAPFELLRSVGLRMNDISRLKRRWERQLEEDPALKKQAAELLKKGAGALPPIRAGVAKLTPFPWSKGVAKSATAPAKNAGRSDSSENELPLDRYAAITAELAETSSNEANVLAKYGLSRALFSTLDVAWKHRLRDDAGLERDYRRLFEHQRARLRASADHDENLPTGVDRRDRDTPAAVPSPAPIQAASSPLVGTSPLLEIPRGLVLPFVHGPPAAEVAKSSAAEGEVPRPRPGLGGTALAVDVPRGPALPFIGAAHPPPTAGASGLGETSLAIEIPRGPTLPFVESDAPPEIAEGTGEPPANRHAEGLGGTALAIDLPHRPALPFVSEVALPEERLPQRAPSMLAETSLTVEVPRGPALPFSKDGASTPTVASAPAPEVAPREDRLGATALAVDIVRAPALPFAASARPEGATPGKKRNPLGDLSLGFKIPENLPPPRQTVSTPPAPATGASAPSLTVEQYASLCVELTCQPEHAAEALARYRITSAQKELLDGQFRERFAKDPGLRESWDHAYRTYREWYITNAQRRR